jgi:predicted nucleotidyltransferase
MTQSNLIETKLLEFLDLHPTIHTAILFGSSLTDAFNNESDIDFLVKFKSIDLSIYFDNFLGLKENLEKLFGRKVDLIEEQTLRNPILIKSINSSKELVYG